MPPTSVMTVVMRKNQPGSTHDVARAFQPDGDAVGLQRGEQHRAVARILVDLPAPLLAFLLQLLEMRRDRGQQLHDDRRRDVRHDVEREDRHAPDGAAREHVEHAENAGLLLPEGVGERLRVDAGDRDIGAEPVDDQRAEREPDALLELVGLGEGREIEIGGELFGGGDHRALSSLDEQRRAARRAPSTLLGLVLLGRLAFGASASPCRLGLLLGGLRRLGLEPRRGRLRHPRPWPSLAALRRGLRRALRGRLIGLDLVGGGLSRPVMVSA